MATRSAARRRRAPGRNKRVSSRLVAWHVLRRPDGLTLRAVDRAAQRAGLSDRDRALVRKLVGTHVRRRGALRAIASRLGERPLKPEVATFVEVGLVQLLFLAGIPDHAAIGETVQAARQALGERPGGVVNAVLRRAQRALRKGSSGDPRRDVPLADLHFETAVFSDRDEHWLLWAEEALSLPVPLGRRWEKRFGRERSEALARAMLLEPDLSLRVARGDVETVRAELAPAVELRPTAHPCVLLAPISAVREVLASPAFARGDVTVQGESALRAAELVGAAPGERILDLCAAPGGKTAVLAATGARVVASDSSERRAQRLRETLARLVPDADVEVRIGDGAIGIEPASFDATLVDVPCSNTGVLAARPGARWRFGLESQQSLGKIQERLLREAAACVRPGGRLVYSTCSVEPEENQRRVRAFLALNADWSLGREIESLPGERGGVGPVDGGYAARLERVAR